MVRMKTLAIISCFFIFVAVSQAADDKPKLKVGIIGLDTSHVIAFTKILNDPKAPAEIRSTSAKMVEL